MGRGAHAAHAAYNASGTQGLAVTNEINDNEEIKSVFITENDSTKQIIHGHNISEMTCSGNLESTTTEKYKLFTPDENTDMLGDIYLNFEMDSKITNFQYIADDSTPGSGMDLENIGDQLRQTFLMTGESLSKSDIDFSTKSVPGVYKTNPADGEWVYINKSIVVVDERWGPVNISVGKGRGGLSGPDFNISVGDGMSDAGPPSKFKIGYFSEIMDIALVDGQAGASNTPVLFIGGEPAIAGNDPYKFLLLDEFVYQREVILRDINYTQSGSSVALPSILKIVTTILPTDDGVLVSGFKDHTGEVLRAPEWFLSYDSGSIAKYHGSSQTTFHLKDLYYDSTEHTITAGASNPIVSTRPLETNSKRLENFNFKDYVISSSVTDPYGDPVYVAGSKHKVLLGVDKFASEGKIKRSYNDGVTWENVNMYDGPNNYYPLSDMYRKNEMLTNKQLNSFAFVRNNFSNNATNLTLGELKVLIHETFGYVQTDIKLLNKVHKVEYPDDVKINDIVSEHNIGASIVKIDLRDYLDVRIKNMPTINDYETIFVNVKQNGGMSNLWPIGKSIQMTSRNATGNYLTFGEFKTKVNNILDVNSNDYTVKVKTSMGSSEIEFTGVSDNTLVTDLGFLQAEKINIKVNNSVTNGNGSLDNNPKSIRLGGTAFESSCKPVDERLNDKFKICCAINAADNIATLKSKLQLLYGGVSSDYLICRKDDVWEGTNSSNLYVDSVAIYALAPTPSVLGGVPANNDTILDTENYNIEVRFKDTHPLISFYNNYIYDPKIIYISIPYYSGTDAPAQSGLPIVQRRTVSILAEDPTDRSVITVSVLKDKINAIMNLSNRVTGSGDPIFQSPVTGTTYKFNLVKDGQFTGLTSDIASNTKNFYHNSVDDTKNIYDVDNPISTKTGEILYLFISCNSTTYEPPYELMTNTVNISFNTDPMYSEHIISRLGVMDDLKYYMPVVDHLVTNDKGLWVASGKPHEVESSSHIPFDMNAEVTVNVRVEPYPRILNTALFVSNNDGYNWYPLKYSIIDEQMERVKSERDPREVYDDANVKNYETEQGSINYISSYVSNLQGDIRVALNATSPVTPMSEGFISGAVLDIQHNQICPDVISASTIKAIGIRPGIVPLISSELDIHSRLLYATSINREYDIYIVKNEVGDLDEIIYTKHSNNKILYNENVPDGQNSRYSSPVSAGSPYESAAAYKKLDSNVVILKKTDTSQINTIVKIISNKRKSLGSNAHLNLGSEQPVLDITTEYIEIEGGADMDGDSVIGFSGSVFFETDSVNKAVLIRNVAPPTTRTEIFSYDKDAKKFKLVVGIDDYEISTVNFLENIWTASIKAAHQSATRGYIAVSHDTVHWRIIDSETAIGEQSGWLGMSISARTNRHQDVLQIHLDDTFRSKELTNDINKYRGISLFHDNTFSGGIKINIDDELIADRTNYIIESYIASENQDSYALSNLGTLYQPNDIIAVNDRVIICGNRSGLDSASQKTSPLIGSVTKALRGGFIFPSGQVYKYASDDIIFNEERSIYTGRRDDQKDFLSNFNMERFYQDPRSNDSEIVYCSGTYDEGAVIQAILAVRVLPLSSERLTPNFENEYFWKLIYAPPLYDILSSSDSNNYEDLGMHSSLASGQDPGTPLWHNTPFEKINDVVFADGKMVIVGRSNNDKIHLCYSTIDYPSHVGQFSNEYTHVFIELLFYEIHTVCFHKGHWFVGGTPIYDDTLRNNRCLAYTNDLTKPWTYVDFPTDGGYNPYEHTETLHDSLYEVNNMEVINVNGITSILTNVSYLIEVESGTAERLNEAVLFIDMDNTKALTFTGRTNFIGPGVETADESSGSTQSRNWPPSAGGDGFTIGFRPFRDKWVNRPFDLEVDGITRKVISTKYSPLTGDMFLVDHVSGTGFYLVPYKEINIPIINKPDDNGAEYPKFIKHFRLGTETLTNKTNGHCYKIAQVQNDNFITGLNSAKYVAAGRGAISPMAHSDDFEKWEYSDASKVFDIVFDVVHKHGLWIAVGEGTYNVAISKDGKSWTGIYSRWPVDPTMLDFRWQPSHGINLISSAAVNTFNSIAFNTEQLDTDILPYIPEIKGIFLKNLSILRLFSRIEYHVGSQLWQTLTFDDIKVMLDTEFGAGEYANLLKNCSILNKDGSTKLTTWIPGFTKTLSSKLETFHNISENGSFPTGLLKDQKLSIKIYYNKLDNVLGNELNSSDMNIAVFDRFMNNTLIPCDRDDNYFIDSFMADNYGFQLGDTYKNVAGRFKLNYSTTIQKLRLYNKRFELDDTEINAFNRGITQMPKITQGLYFDADNTANLLLDLDSFNLYASHIIVSGWLTSGVHIKDLNLKLNGYPYHKTLEPSVIDYATKSVLGLNYNRYTFNGVDKEDGICSLVIPLASSAYSGSCVPLDRYSSIQLEINFNKIASSRSYINVTCLGTTAVSYNNSTANIDIY